MDSRLQTCKIYAACDVKNTLTGSQGAAHTFGPQKGASPAMVIQLENNLKHLSDMIRKHLSIDTAQLQGGGAAGGMGAGIVAFLNGQLKTGFDLVSQSSDLEKWVKWSDLVITGEGKMDSQTLFGKTPAGVGGMAKRLNKPVIAFTGALGDQDPLKEMGFTAVIPIANRPMSLEQSIGEAGQLLEDAAERTMELIRLSKLIRL
jgi:glycerate kinase